MKHGFKALLFALLSLCHVAAQVPDPTNSRGGGIDTPEERTAFKTALQLENANNTSDASKPVSTAQQTALDLKADKSAMTWIDVTKAPYSAAGDAQYRINGAITSGTATLTSATANFVAGDVGKYIRVEGAGAAGADLITTIAARNSGTSVTLSANAGTTVSSNAVFFWGTDDSAAFNAAITAAASTSTVTRTVYAPPLRYIANVTLKRNVKLLGAWRGSEIESVFSVAQLDDRNLTGTVLFPANTSNPVIKGDATTKVFGSGVEGFVISGSSAKHGTGIQFGGDWGTVLNFSSGSLDIVRCQISGFDTAIKHSNAVEGNIQYVHWNDCNTGVELWAHDAVTIRNSGSNTIGGNNFRIGGSKNVVIETGNYNHLNRFADITDSTVYVDAVNVEFCVAECFATRFSADATKLIVGHVKLLTSTSGILVRDYYPEAQKQNCSIEIQSTTGNSTYWDSANSNYPQMRPPCSYIRRYVDNTFATLQQTETVGRVYFTEEDRRTHSFLEESFGSRFTTPFCDLGWTAGTVGSWDMPNNISSAYVGFNQFAPGGLRIASSTALSTNIVRFAAQSSVIPPGKTSYWYLRAAVQSTNSGNGIWRFGVYSQDSSTTKPTNGVGLLADTNVNANFQLEVINGGASTLVDTGIAVANANPALSPLRGFKEVTLQMRPSLGLSVIIKDLNGIALGPEVFIPLASISDTWPNYHCISCYAGSNTNTLIELNFGKLTFVRYRTTM